MPRLPASVLKDTRGLTKRSSPFFLVRVRANRLGRNRWAVIVGIKTDRRAVVRHTLKRRVIARLRGRAAAGHDIIVSVLAAARDLPRKKFYEELEKILS